MAGSTIEGQTCWVCKTMQRTTVLCSHNDIPIASQVTLLLALLTEAYVENGPISDLECWIGPYTPHVMSDMGHAPTDNKLDNKKKKKMS